jgi:hypothetical protein
MKDNEQQRQQVSSSSHRKTASIPPVLSFSTSRNQIFIFLLLFFAFVLFDIFSNQGHKGTNSTKYQLKPMIDVIGTNSRAFGKTGVGTSKLESSASLIFLNFLRMAYLV